MRSWEEIVIPVDLPWISGFANRWLAKLSPFRYLALANFVLARPQAVPASKVPTVSVIVAARNEAGHLAELLSRIPEMGAGTEIIFVEGNSTDNTYEAIEDLISEHPQKNLKLFKQIGKSKGDAVRLGFEQATGDILMILDADIVRLR